MPPRDPTMSSRPVRTAARSRSSGRTTVPGADGEQGIPIADHPGSRSVKGVAGHGQRGQGPVVDVDPPVLLGVRDHRMAAAAVEPGRQMPVAEQVSVGPDDDRLSGPELPPELRRRAHRSGGPRPVGRQAEPGNDLGQAAVEVVRGVGEPEGDDPAVVVLELPEDVPGAEAAGDQQDQLLREWSLAAHHAGVGQHVGQRRRIGLGPAPQGPASIDHRPRMIVDPAAPYELGPGRGVPLAGGRHPGPDAGLEVLLCGHIETFRPHPDARLHASKRRRDRAPDVPVGWLSWRLSRSPLLPHRRAAWKLDQGVRRQTRRAVKVTVPRRVLLTSFCTAHRTGQPGDGRRKGL